MLDPLSIKYFKLAVSEFKETENDISARCPICGDSQKHKKKKRLHLFTKNSFDTNSGCIHCFNCEFKGNISSFLKIVDTILYDCYKQETKQKYFNSLKEKKEISDLEKNLKSETKIPETKIPETINNDTFILDTVNDNINDNINDTETKTIPLNDTNTNTNTKSINDVNDVNTFNTLNAVNFLDESNFFDINDEQKEYLKNRFIPEKFYHLFKRINNDTRISTFDFEQCIIIPFRNNNEIIGFQARHLKRKSFFIYVKEGYQKIWNKDVLLQPNQNQKQKKIYVFESVFDALSSGKDLNEICASLGVGTKLFNQFNQKDKNQINKKIIYCYDNQWVDEASFKRSLKLIDLNSVFIWPATEIKDFNELLFVLHQKTELNKNEIFSKISKLIDKNIYNGFLGKIKLTLNIKKEPKEIKDPKEQDKKDQTEKSEKKEKNDTDK